MRSYDRPYRRPRSRYDYDTRELGGRPDPYTGWYPGAYWAGAPMFGWGGMDGWGWPPYMPVGVGRYPGEERPRYRPRESPAYGRGGDEAARRWAERYGYDVEFSIHPRDRPRGRYERDWRAGRSAGW
jgi:hypothetical protein